MTVPYLSISLYPVLFTSVQLLFPGGILGSINFAFVLTQALCVLQGTALALLTLQDSQRTYKLTAKLGSKQDKVTGLQHESLMRSISAVSPDGQLSSTAFPHSLSPKEHREKIEIEEGLRAEIITG